MKALQADPRCSARSPPMRRRSRRFPASRRRSPRRSTALRRGCASAAVGGHLERGNVGACGQSVGLFAARRPAAGARGDRRAIRSAFAALAGHPRRSPRSWPTRRRSAALQATPMRSRTPRRRPQRTREWRAMLRRSRACSRQQGDEALSGRSQGLLRRSATMRSRSRALPAMRSMLSPQLLSAIGSNASAFSNLASNAAQLSAASQALQALDAHSLVASAAAAGRSMPRRRRRCLPTRRPSRR